MKKYLGILAAIAFSCSQQSEPTTPSTDKLFTKISPEQSGIQFINNLNETKQFNLFTWKYIYNGAGVAAGDINNDGLVDLYFSGNANANKLYINKGDFQFEDISNTSGTATPQGYKTGVSMVDINADGWLDIYVCRDAHGNPNIRNNLVYINNHDNNFTEKGEELGLIDQAYSTQSVFFDMDQDGDLDLFLVNHPSDFDESLQMRVTTLPSGEMKRTTEPKSREESYHLYENTDGHFEDITLEAGLAYQGFGLSALANDFNHDGLPDLFVANDFLEPDVIFINNGDRTFRESNGDYFDHMSQNSMGSDLGDFNNDGELDMVVLDMLAETNERQKIFATSMSQNRYERLDNFGYGRQLMRNVLQMQTPDHTFSEVGCLAGIEKTDWSWSPLFADVNLDGHQDLLITNGIKRDMSNQDFINFNADSIQKANQQGVDVFNQNTILSWIDLIPSTPIANYLYRNQGDYTFTNIALEQGLEEPGFSQGAAFADLDNDGDLDLVINNMDAIASVYKNNSETKQKHFLKIKLQGPSQNPFGVGAKITISLGGNLQSALIQSSRGYLSSCPPEVIFGLDDAKSIEKLTVLWPDGKSQLLSNVKIDQAIRIEYNPDETKSATKTKEYLKVKDVLFTHVEPGFNDFKQEPLLFKPNSHKGPSLAVGDVNGDGITDAYIGGAANQSGQLLIGKDDGSYLSKPLNIDLQSEDHAAVFFDLENDGDQDLYVVSGGVSFPVGDQKYQDRLYINDGKGNFKKGTLPNYAVSGNTVSASDFDQDGDIDLFIGAGTIPANYPAHGQSIILVNENGKLSPGDLIQVNGIVNKSLWWDYDKDGFEDLILAGEWMPITIFKNEDGKSFSNVTAALGLSKTNGLWSSLEISDLDGDGQPELIAGNYGLNNLFEVTSKTPLTALQADFDNNDQQETIITYYLNGEEWPLPRKEMITSVLPSLKKKFLNNASYSVAKIEDVFSPEQLQKASKKYVHELRSGYFTFKDNKFVYSPLPNIAQTFPVFSSLSEDFNDDGVKDLLIGGNMTYAEVEQGPYDAGAGLILWGQRQTDQFDNRHSTFLDWNGDIRDIKLINNQIWVVKNNGPLTTFTVNK